MKKPVLKHAMYAVIAVFSCVCAGCGYSTRSLIADQYKTLYVAQFVNKIDLTKESDAARKYKIYRPLLETDITKTLINRFLFDGNLKPVKSEAADLILRGELIEFRRDPLRYDGDEVEEYRLTLVVSLTLRNRQNDALIWEEKHFVGDTTYFTQGINMKSEDTAINDAIDDVCRRIVERVIEQW